MDTLLKNVRSDLTLLRLEESPTQTYIHKMFDSETNDEMARPIFVFGRFPIVIGLGFICPFKLFSFVFLYYKYL